MLGMPCNKPLHLHLQHSVTGATLQCAEKPLTESQRYKLSRTYLEELLCKQLFGLGMDAAPTEPAVVQSLQTHKLAIWPEPDGAA